MSTPSFELADIGDDCYTINDQGRTVAIVTSQGYIDWLLRSPMEDGPLLTSIRKETHLSYTLGLKLELITPTPPTRLKRFSHRIEADGARLILTGEGETEDGAFRSETTAVLGTDDNAVRYQWELETIITCTAKDPVTLRWIEFNNVFPGLAGRCMLYAPQKEYNCTLMVDRDGVVWNFPHQHLMHYTGKIAELQFAPGTMAGFFGEETGSPVVIIGESTLAPDWAICDMYYDLHCGARLKAPVQPGERHTFRYTVKYLGQAECAKLLEAARPVPVEEQDYARHDYARLELGMNDFSRPVAIDAPDEASGFRQNPPQKVWDRTTGHSVRGSLRITNKAKEETVWGAEPQTNIPPGTVLNIKGRIKTEDVEGPGAFIRVAYFTYCWRPEPHLEYKAVRESPPVSGTTDDWVEIAVPELRVPEEDFDYLIELSFVLNGKGVAWLTDVDIDLQPLPAEEPEIEEGSSKRRGKRSADREATASGAAR